MLTLELELMSGAYRASTLDGARAEWPPHPERIFSALVQSWADGGKSAEERAALKWLEGLDAPDVEASREFFERDAPVVFVPPNDPRGNDLAVLPERRRRQARAFRVAVPAEEVVRLHWDVDVNDDVLAALERLAHRTASIGHSASLVRLAFRTDLAPRVEGLLRAHPDGEEVLRVPYRGRLADLERWFHRQPLPERPRSLRSERYRWSSGQEAAAPTSAFGDAQDWFVFEDLGGWRPDLLAFAHVARRVRDALMKVGPQPPPEVLSGHGSDGQPSTRSHVAIVPLANVGWPRATGDLLGFAIVLPRGLAQAERAAVLTALGGLIRVDGDRSTVVLRMTRERAWTVERCVDPSRASLRPERWCASASEWASVTPVLLDRFPDHGDAIEEAQIIAQACQRIGVGEPIEIEIHKHSAIEGAPSAYPSRGRGHLPEWTFPRDAASRDRPRRHVVLRFDRPVRGPVMIGAGRYQGFGLCVPLKRSAS